VRRTRFLGVDIGHSLGTSLGLGWERLAAALGRLRSEAIVEELFPTEPPLIGSDERRTGEEGQGSSEKGRGNQVLDDHGSILSALKREKPGAGPGIGRTD